MKYQITNLNTMSKLAILGSSSIHETKTFRSLTGCGIEKLKVIILFFIFSCSLSFGSVIENTVMKAGVAKAVITNKLPGVMANGNTSDGMLYDINARVLVINDGVKRMIFVTYDLNCLDVGTPILRKRVKDELGIDPAQLVLLATHNHSALIQIDPANFEYGKWLADRIFNLIKEAIDNEQGPVTLKFGFGNGYFITARPTPAIEAALMKSLRFNLLFILLSF